MVAARGAGALSTRPAASSSRDYGADQLRSAHAWKVAADFRPNESHAKHTVDITGRRPQKSPRLRGAGDRVDADTPARPGPVRAALQKEDVHFNAGLNRRRYAARARQETREAQRVRPSRRHAGGVLDALRDQLPRARLVRCNGEPLTVLGKERRTRETARRRSRTLQVSAARLKGGPHPLPKCS